MRAIIPGGLEPQQIQSGRRDLATIAGYLELHIEQGPRLEKAGIPIGVVDTIYGRRSMRITWYGRPDHAGTTPLNMRADALLSAAQFITQATQMVGQSFPNAVLTFGGIQAKPGVYNVVSNEVILLVEFRAADEQTLQKIEKSLLDLATKITAVSDDLAFTSKPFSRESPIPLSPAIQEAIHTACERLAYPALNLSSGALHDAGILAASVPVGLIFIPSIGGRSHSPDENSTPADLIAGANVLLQTTLILAHET